MFSIIIVRSCADTALNNTYIDSKIKSMHFRTNTRTQHTTQLETFHAGGNPDEEWDPALRGSQKRSNAEILHLQTTSTNTRNTDDEDQQDRAQRDSKVYRGDGDIRV